MNEPQEGGLVSDFRMNSTPPTQLPPMPSPGWPGKVLVNFLFFTVFYLLFDCFGHWLTQGKPQYAILWSPLGLLLGLLLTNPISKWPWFLLGSLIGEISSNQVFYTFPFWLNLGLAIATGIAAASGAWLTRKITGKTRLFGNTRDLRSFFLFGLTIGPIVGATIGTFFLWVDSRDRDLFITWLDLSTTAIVSILILTPFFTTLKSNIFTYIYKNISIQRSIEFLLIVLLFGGISQWIFGRRESVPVGFLIVTLIIWPAIRFGITGVSITVFLCCVIAINNVGQGHVWSGTSTMVGPHQVIFIKIFLSSCSFTGLFIAISFREKNHSNLLLKITNRSLEKRVSERTRELLVQKQELEATFDHAFIGMAILSTEGKVLKVNQAVCKLLGILPEEIVNLPFQKVVHPDEWEEDQKIVQQVFHSRTKGFQIERRMAHKDGHELACIISLSFVESLGGRDPFVIAQIADITQAKKDRMDLRKSEEQFRQIAETIDEVFWVANLDISINEYASPAFEKIWGRSRETLQAHPKSFLDAIIPEDRAKLAPVFENPYRDTAFENEYRIQRPDGSIRVIWDRGYPVRDKNGKVIKFVGVAQDITERKKAEILLRESQERLALALNTGNIGIWDWNLVTNAFVGSDSLIEMLGFQKGDFTPTMEEFYKLLHPDDFPKVKKALADHFENRADKYLVEYRLKGKNGEYYTNISSAKVVERDPKGKPIRMLGTQTDITPLKKVEDALKQSEIRFQLLADKAPVGIFRTDAQGHCLFVNEAWCKMTGMPLQKALGDGWLQAVYPEDKFNIVQGWEKTVKENGSLTLEFRFLTQDDKTIWVRGTAIPIVVGPEKEINLIGTLADVTEQKDAETTLKSINRKLEERVAERTEALSRVNQELALVNEELAKSARHKDEFLASMSHELRTPLNGVLGLSEAIQEGVYGSINSEQQSALKDIEQSGRHLLTLINDVLDLAKMEAGKITLELTPTSVEEVCQASLRLIKQSALKKQLKVQLNLERAPQTILADQRRLKQMLVNLLGNAVKFTPEQGSIGLEVVGDEENHLVKMIVWDTGIGIPKEKIHLLFHSFQQIDTSLSRKYSGSGLGLALVRRMAELHQGSVGVETELGKGSRFSFTIPWNKKEVEDLSNPCPSGKPA